MNETEWNPACSFCGVTLPAELIRAGARDYWICSACIDQPVIEDKFDGGTVCTFCEKPIAFRGGEPSSSARQMVVARRGAVLCNECIPICMDLIAEGRARRAKGQSSP